jgi:hypothetical protein
MPKIQHPFPQPLNFSKIDKFASKIEANADMIGNAVIVASQAFGSNDEAERMVHLNNILDLTRNIKSEANLERLKIRNLNTTYAVKKHISGTEIINPMLNFQSSMNLSIFHAIKEVQTLQTNSRIFIQSVEFTNN